MYKARYYKADGKKGKARALPDQLFDGVVNESVMHQVVKAYLSNQRQGTAAAKSRGQVAGGGAKPWRQKGTGRARAGTIRAVQWAGGGDAFPPMPHSWRERVPKKVKALARRSALNARAEHDRVLLADMPNMEKPRTKDMLGFLSGIEADGKVLILTDGKKDNVYLSARNIPNVQVHAFGNESVYDLLWANFVIIERSAMDTMGADAPVAEEAEKPAAKKAAAKKPAAKKAKKAAAKTEEPVEETAPEAEAAVEEAPEVEVAEEKAPVAEAAVEADDDTEDKKEGDDA